MAFYHKHVPLRLLIAQGEKNAAAEKLKALYEEDVRGKLLGMAVKVRVCQTLAADTTDSALQFLADVLAAAEPEGYVRTFVDEGRLLAPLLRQAISRGISPDYAARLLGIIEAEELQKQKHGKDQKPLISERELEVLRLLEEGLSNEEIAGKLVITLSTTKNHVHSILDKLGVRRRSQAVAQARQMKLL
jgi:LuxR family maltose regulon positive regulatory protein